MFNQAVQYIPHEQWAEIHGSTSFRCTCARPQEKPKDAGDDWEPEPFVGTPFIDAPRIKIKIKEAMAKNPNLVPKLSEEHRVYLDQFFVLEKPPSPGHDSDSTEDVEEMDTSELPVTHDMVGAGPSKDKKSKAGRPPKQDRLLSCDRCDFVSKHKGDWTKHKKLEHKLQCPECVFVFVSRSKLTAHIAHCHPYLQSERFPCPFCGSILSSANSLKQHVFDYHKE